MAARSHPRTRRRPAKRRPPSSNQARGAWRPLGNCGQSGRCQRHADSLVVGRRESGLRAASACLRRRRRILNQRPACSSSTRPDAGALGRAVVRGAPPFQRRSSRRTAGAAGPAAWGGGFRAGELSHERRFAEQGGVGTSVMNQRSAVFDASTARRDERLRRCHRPVCTWIMRVGARHRTWRASAPRLAGRRPTPLRAQDAAPPSYTLESAFGRARRHSATTEDGRRRRRGGFKLLVCVARSARRRMHHRLWLPHEA